MDEKPWNYKDYEGIKIGELTIIGKTGEKSSNGESYVLVRNSKDGTFSEHLVSNILSKDRRKRFKGNKGLDGKPRKNNTSGYPGVSFQKNMNKWFAYIWRNGRRYPLGYYKYKKDAIQARQKAENNEFNQAK